MNSATEKSALQLRSLVRKTGELELSLVSVDIPVPADNEVLIRIEASPINPSDIGLLFGAADMSTATVTQGEHGPVVTARIPEKGMKAPAWSSRLALPTPRRS